MSDRLDEPDLVLLARVIDRGSFARAAKELQVPPSTLSRRIAGLERRIGVRTLERTTRHLRPTEVGELLAASGRRVRAELEDAERLLADHRLTPRGLLRLSVPSPSVDFIAPVIAEMLTRYPELRVEVVAADGLIDVVGGGFDAALHVGAITGSSTLGVLRLGRISPVLAAATSYLKRAPPIRHPRDLADAAHTIIGYRRPRRTTWEFAHGTRGTTLTVTPAAPRAMVPAKTFSAQLVAAGAGLAMLPRAAALALTNVTILEPAGYRPTSGAFSLVTPSARSTAPKVRAFVSALKALVGSKPELFT